MERYTLAARDWLQAHIHPVAPYALLTLVIWLLVAGVRRYRPEWWLALEKHGPQAKLASKIFQGLPSVLIGALWVTAATGGDYHEAWKGALAGAFAPLIAEVKKLLGGKPPGGTLMPVAALLFIGVTSCSTAKPAARTVHDAARVLCETFFAERQGISLEEAARTACATERQLRPFLDEALRARQLAGSRANP